MKIFIYPYIMRKPINSHDYGFVYRIREDELPKKYKKDDLLKIETEQGICFLKMANVENAERFEQVFRFPNNPMKLRQVICRPIYKKDEERIKFDTYWSEDKEFINQLLK